MRIFEQAQIGNRVLNNRIIRSATYEGMCDPAGVPGEEYKEMYVELARRGVGGIIAGFAYVSREGRAMHPGQAGIDTSDKVRYFKDVTDAVHEYGGKIFLQLAHTGRQTRSKVTGEQVYGVSSKKSWYFNERPEPLTTEGALRVVEQFERAAIRAKEAGFDGVQLHAAHGYLIHQFLLPVLNKRHDLFGIDPHTRLGTKFLQLIIERVRLACGEDFPILVKISSGDDYLHPFTKEQFLELVRFLDLMRVDAIEVSYGTMDYALNIFRGDIPLDLILRQNPLIKIENPVWRAFWKRLIYPFLKVRLHPFTPMYNLDAAVLAKSCTDIPIISVGGFRTGSEIGQVLEEGKVDFVSLSRPFLAEPDFVERLQSDENHVSFCVNCNLCVIMCDSKNPTRCYKRGRS